MTSRPSQRSAFTLVELLVVITIIGILLGMAIIAIGPAMRRSRELGIELEMYQLDQAIESFKIKYGFYPPDFTAFGRDPANPTNPPNAAVAVNQFLPFLNRIAPQHNELALDDGSNRNIDNWWVNVGSKLDQDSCLVFWLSGLAKSKQYPLTNGAGFALSAHPWNPADNGIPREIFFDFKNPQVDIDASDPLIAHYHQPRAEGESNYSYFRYTLSLMDDLTTTGVRETELFLGYKFIVPATDPRHNPVFPFPEGMPEAYARFQLVCPGLDERLGTNQNWLAAEIAAGDNIVNFIADGSCGRLDRKMLGLED